MRNEADGVSEHDRKRKERARLPLGEQGLVLLRCLVVAVIRQGSVDGFSESEVQVPDRTVNGEEGEEGESGEGAELAPLRAESDEESRDEEDEDERRQFRHERGAERGAEEDAGAREEPRAVPPLEAEQESEEGEGDEEGERPLKHGATHVNDERVVERGKKTQECGEHGAAGDEQEDSEEDRHRHPCEQYRKQPVSGEGEACGRVLAVIGIDELIINGIRIHRFLSESNEHFAKRRMLFHEVHAIQVLLCARDVVVLVPEERGGRRVVVDVGEIRKQNDEAEEEPCLSLVCVSLAAEPEHGRKRSAWEG